MVECYCATLIDFMDSPRFTFDNGIAIQFAQYILSRDRKRWGFVEQGCKVTLCELATALKEYHSFAMGHVPNQENTSSLSRILGFNVRDLSYDDSRKLLGLFYKSLARFYEETIIPFYITSSLNTQQQEEDCCERNILRRLATPIV